MIATDLGRGASIVSVPLVADAGFLSMWWIYAVSFVSACLTIAFDAAQFAAIPSLVASDDLVTANGRIQASYRRPRSPGRCSRGCWSRSCGSRTSSWSTPPPSSFRPARWPRSRAASTPARRGRKHIRHDIAEGLRYVLGHPVLRNIR